MTCKNHLPYNLYCVGGDVKHCSLTHSLTHSLAIGDVIDDVTWLTSYLWRHKIQTCWIQKLS